MRCRSLFVGGAIVLLAGLAARAEVIVVAERNENASASFKFTKVPAPAKNDAASQARFTLVDGQRDSNGGTLRALNDGRLPTEEDQPGSNFFFAQAADGGRIGVDLGKVIEVKQVNTYSWHGNTRGPQVYILYGSDGSAAGFNARPKKDTDPATCGWKRLAAVDTRPKSGEMGGQYGVSIADPAGAIGKYRYLLLDVSATEKDDPFGNTFYSEIDVIDAAGPAPVAAGAGPTTRLTSKSPDSAEYQITIDYTDAPDLKDWVVNKLQPALDKWYPILVKSLPSDGYKAPAKFTVSITEDYRGVAATMGTRVVCDVNWFRQNLNGEAVGAVVHELVHVVQQYGRVRGASRNPGWLVEGVADYIRWFKYEPTPAGTRPRNPDRAKYTDSYRTTAGFLNFVIEKHDKDLIAQFNAAMRQGKYSPDLWKQYTGKTVDELWDEYVATLKK